MHEYLLLQRRSRRELVCLRGRQEDRRKLAQEIIAGSRAATGKQQHDRRAIGTGGSGMGSGSASFMPDATAIVSALASSARSLSSGQVNLSQPTGSSANAGTARTQQVKKTMAAFIVRIRSSVR